MAEQIPVTLSSELQTALEDLSRDEGVSRDELIDKAIREFLLLRRFRLMRDRMIPKAQAHGVVTDQDVFDRVS